MCNLGATKLIQKVTLLNRRVRLGIQQVILFPWGWLKTTLTCSGQLALNVPRYRFWGWKPPIFTTVQPLITKSFVFNPLISGTHNGCYVN